MDDIEDKRKEFIANISASYFGLQPQYFLTTIRNNTDIDQFFDNRENLLLVVHLNSSKPVIQNILDGVQNALVFYKVSPELVTDTNLSDIIRICSFQNSMLDNFYNVLQAVYLPSILIKEDERSEDIKLRNLFEDVESCLKNAILHKTVYDTRKGELLSNLNSIFSYKDECQYWTCYLGSISDQKEKRRAQKILNILSPLQSKFSESLPISELDNFVEDVYNTLDDLWKLEKCNFPEDRIINLFDIIGNFISYCIQKELKNRDLWNEPYYSVNDLLLDCLDISTKWIDNCQQLTSIFWVNYSSHPWSGRKYEPNYIFKFTSRLQEILDVRNIHQTISQMLTKAENEALKIASNFSVFSHLNAVQYNSYTDHLWKAAVNSFFQCLKPAQEYIVKRIKEKLNQANADTLQVLECVKKYQNLIRIPEIKEWLKVERQNVLITLQDYIDGLSSKNFHSSHGSLKVAGLVELPEIIWKLIKIKETSNNLKDIEIIVFPVLKDLLNFAKLEESLMIFRKNLNSVDSQIFNEWTAVTFNVLKNSDFSLRTEDPVLYFEENKLMKVNYSPKLVMLIKEVHNLQLLGYNIPFTILEVAEKAKLFLRQAEELEQISNFHNTIGDRMVPSQRPMMLASAVELSKLIKQENSVTWSNSQAVDEYIGRLQILVDRLGFENNTLYKYHSLMVDKVTRLLETDITQRKIIWNDIMGEIRSIVGDVKARFSNCNTWLVHWDHQIYKALQVQYQNGLLHLTKQLSEIKVDLVYRQQQLQFRPQLEEIKKKYYFQLKQLITLPLTFQGISHISDKIFSVMVDRNANKFPQVYSNAEKTFEQLIALKDTWVDRIALGSVNLESLVGDHLKSAENWQLNFKTSKSWGQEIAKLAECEQKIECITINIAPVRSEIELHNNRYWDILRSSLYTSIVTDLKSVSDFIKASRKQLEYQPQTYEEIGDASEAYHKIVSDSDWMLATVDEMNKKNQVLSSWTKESISQVADIEHEWNNFHSLLDNQQYYINRQIESIKNNVITESDNLSSEAEKFILRWKRVRPKETDLIDGNYNTIENNIAALKEKRKEWDLLNGKLVKLKRDIQRFGITSLTFPNYEEVESDLSSCEKMWGLQESFIKGISEFSSEEWIIFRTKGIGKFEAFLAEWEEKLLNMTVNPLIAKLISKIQKFKDFIPLIKYVRGDVFSNKHWFELCSILKIIPKPVEELSCGDFLEKQDIVLDNIDKIKELNNKAANEAVVRQALAELDVWEVESKFNFMSHITSSGQEIFLINDFKDILSKLGDNQCLLQSMVGSPNYDQFQDLTSMWESKLTNLDYFLKNFMEIQRKWLYLEPIMKNETIQIEKARFDRIDKDIHFVMEALHSGDQRVISLCRIPNIKSIINTLVQQLEICQKSLNMYLEEKRLKFPRFYFLSDDDLLQILGQANKPEIVQLHMKKLFAGINDVIFSKNNIEAVRSVEGEVVKLIKSVEISLDVENWLHQLSTEVTKTLKKLLKDCIKQADPILYPSQILCLAECVSFTSRCEEAIKNGKLKSLLISLNEQLDIYTKLDLELNDGDDSLMMGLKLKALIFDTIYHSNIVKKLINSSTTSVDEWIWQMQLRFYIEPLDSVKIKIVDAEFEYTFEYQGNSPKLVHTPLTDRCYLTLTQAISMGLGGNPYGPAGTGKTESVKALGRLFGRQVLVFNCDEGLDIASLTRILIGLVKCGAWGCFDEFNRLEEATLSAVSTQIHIIQEALRSGDKNVIMMDREVVLDRNTGIFVTMNPAGRTYGGRQKLPDNLKQLFRPIAMSEPDNLQIAEVILHSEGFKNAKLIARKLVQTFEISKNILSKQNHYDWGLRALKTVIGGCKSALKHSRLLTQESVDEMSLVVHALRLNTLSKLTSEDAELFDQLVLNTFKNIHFETQKDSNWRRAIEDSFKSLNLQYNSIQSYKCLELYEQLEQRTGVVIVGPSGSGKSAIRRLLNMTLKIQNRNVKQYIINPKSMSRIQLLGQIDHDTRQWMDGVLSITAQKVYNEAADVESWIVFDGDIDPEWIESLNSVLDDNRLLTLPSGWRIHFGPNVHFIFETHSLEYASPATVSRMGIILLSENDVLKCVTKSWLETTRDDNRALLTDLINKYFYKSIDSIRTKTEGNSNMPIYTVVKNCLSLMKDSVNKTEFCSSVINGLCVGLDVSCHEFICKQVLEWAGEFIPDLSKVSYCYYNSSKDSIDTYSADLNTNSTIVKTAQIKSSLKIMKIWLLDQQPVILMGPQGSGKTQLLELCASELGNVEIETFFCSSQITPYHLLQKLSQLCVSVHGNNGLVCRPKLSSQLIIHIKDLNLAHTDKWGTNMLLAFLHQVLSYHGFYDPESVDWVRLERIQFVCSVLSCDNISSRFIRCCHLMILRPPEHTDLHTICTAFLKPMKMNANLESISRNIITRIYIKMQETFNQIPHTNYDFNLRDLYLWCAELRRYNATSNQEIIRALLYEGDRLFLDRLTNQADKDTFIVIEKSIVDSEMGMNTLNDECKNLIFNCDAGRFNSITLDDWKANIQRNINILENEGEFIDSKVLQPELLRMVAYFERVLTRPGGCLLLPSYFGFGRKSAVRIVACRQSARVHSLNISSSYSINNFKNDMKMILQLVGLENQIVYFILDDYHIVNDTVLNYINSLLASGEIPGLYQTDEFETLCSPLKDVIHQYDFQGTCCQFFIDRVRKNLHIIIVSDYNLNKANNRWTGNPIVRRRCQIIWLPEWRQETKEAILNSTINDCEAIQPELDRSIINHFIQIHEDAKVWMTVTPRHFVLLSKTYLNIFRVKQNFIADSHIKLKAGLSKLTEAKTIVAQLKEDAAQQELKLAEKQGKANVALELITQTMQSASSQKTEMESLKENIEKESEAAAFRKRQIDTELSEVEPILAEARSAVGNIKSESLSEIRSLRAPPEIIHDILEGVLRLMGIQDTSWNSMKTFLAKRGVKEDIKCFDARSIFPENREMVEDLLRKREKSFEGTNAKRASAAAAPLAAWVIANVKYSKILEKIKPLESEQNKLQQKLKHSENEILLLSSGLNDVEQNVHQLKEQLNTNTKEAAEIEIHLHKVKDTILAAEDLVTKLNDEYSRWSEMVSDLSKDLGSLKHNCLLSAAILVYLSHSSEEMRKTILKKWECMLGLQDFKLEKFLNTEQEQLKWISEGLPSDYLSIQNAVIISQATLTPFLIDPSNIALSWLEKLLKATHSVEITSLHGQNIASTLELATRFGKALIIRDVITIDPILLPILKRNYIYQGTRKMIRIGEKHVDCHPNFQIYLISRNSESIIEPYFSCLFNSINFEVTHRRLSQQLLRCALSVENPNLEKRRVELLKREEALKNKLFTLQDNILIELANAHGNILENKELLVTLNETKKHSTEIKISLLESEKIQDELSKEYEGYQPLSEKAAIVYFSVLSLRSINHFYQISMDSFIKIYQNIFSFQADESMSMNQRMKTFVHSVYNHVCRFLFKEDILTFALHLVHNIYPNLFQPNEWELFKREIIVDTQSNAPEVLNSVPVWASKDQAFDIYLMKIILPSLYNQLDIQNTLFWQTFTNSQTIELTPLKITQFQTVLVVQAFKPGFLHSALISFAKTMLGLRSLIPSPLSMEKIFVESSCTNPLLIIISPGVDPSDEIRTLAKTRKQAIPLEVALGQGQMDSALKSLHDCAQNGNWLIMKNLHLMSKWLSTLEEEIKLLKDVNENFRLWLTSEPHSNFPSTFLQMCLKVTYETPEGLKLNLDSNYHKLTKGPLTSIEYARSIFVLSWFHAVIQERRSYIPQGWRKFYEFNDSDLFAAFSIVKKRLKSDNRNIKWNYILGLLDDVIYGGRIDNSLDMRILNSYSRSFFNNDIIINGLKSIAPNIQIPYSCEIKEFQECIQNLPETNDPQYFTLPLNVNMSWQKKKSSDVISCLRALKRESVVSTNPTLDEWKSKLSPILHLWKQLNQEVGMLKMKKLDERHDDLFRQFLTREFNFALSLVTHIHKSLVDVNKITKAAAALNNDLMPLILNVSSHVTPNHWLNQWEGNADIILYIKGVMYKAQWIITLRKSNMSLEDFVKNPVDLKQFFNPQTFLSIFKQHSSKSSGIPLDELQLSCSFKSIHKSRNICILEGLLIDGAYIDSGGNLCENKPNSLVLNCVPDLKIHWSINEVANLNKGDIISIPVFHNSSRDNILMNVQMPIDVKEFDKWIQVNPAFYLQE